MLVQQGLCPNYFQSSTKVKNDAQTVWKRLGEPRASALNQLGMELTHPTVEVNKLSPSRADQQDEQTTTSKTNEP